MILTIASNSSTIWSGGKRGRKQCGRNVVVNLHIFYTFVVECNTLKTHVVEYNDFTPVAYDQCLSKPEVIYDTMHKFKVHRVNAHGGLKEVAHCP